MTLLWLSTPTPSPLPGFEGDPDMVTPGVIGFVVTFLVAAATVLLIIDMTRRVRRVRYREEVREELEAELEAAATASGAPTASDETSAHDARPGDGEGPAPRR